MRQIGSGLEPVIEERPETVDMQLRYLARGTIAVVMIPVGSAYVPKTPPGMESLDVLVQIRGAGRYIFNPALISVNQVLSSVLAGNHGSLLGHLFNKNASKPSHVVSARTASGVVIQDSVVPFDCWQATAKQYAEMHKRFPEAVISLQSAEEILYERLA